MLAVLNLNLHRLISTAYFWLILAAIQFVLAWSFLVRIETWLNDQNEAIIKDSLFGVTDFVLTPLFQLALLLLCFILPFLTAQAISGEKQQRTWALLASSAISKNNIILAKYISLLLFCCVPLLIILLMGFSLSFNTQLDYGQLLNSGLLFLCCCSAMIMLGLFISSYSQHTITAAIITLPAYIFIFNTHWFIIDKDLSLIKWLSFRQHMLNAYHGLLSSYDILFFFAGTLILFVLTLVRLERE